MLGFGTTRAAGLAELLSRKKYARAIEVIREDLKHHAGSASLRLQLADVLQRADRGGEAVPLLLELADEFALAGSPAKAIAALKRAQAISPGQPRVEEHLAYLIAQQKAPTPDPWRRAARLQPESSVFPGDIEEIDSATPAVAPPAVAADPPPVTEETALGLDSEQGFIDEVVALVDDVLTGKAAPQAVQLTSVPAVDTPLFRGFSAEELVEVIRGLRLRSFEPGEIIVTEGEPGESLFLLTAGRTRTYVRGADQRNAQVRTLGEGEFFGEVSLLEFEGRTATITAASRCELLEIDRPTLDGIARTHPRVWDVIRRFYQARAGSEAERAARAGARPPQD